MTTEFPSKSLSAPFNPGADDDINLRQVIRALLRHKRLISLVAGSTLFLSSAYAFISKPVWEGQFEIVLQNSVNGFSDKSQFNDSSQILAKLAIIGSDTVLSRLETEVKILKSPLVLKPVFDYVKTKKGESGKHIQPLTFRDWLPNLSVKLESSNSVLNVSYRDTNQELVLSVIGQVSEAYQKFYERDRSRGLNQGVTYIEEKLAKLLPKADASMRAAQNYALANGLPIQNGLGAGAGSTRSTSNSSLEASREAVQKRVNTLRQKLVSARNAGNQVYVAAELSANSRLYAELQTLEAQLEEKSALLRSNDPTIIALQRQRMALTKILNLQTISLLEEQLRTGQAQLSSLSKPREVILKHHELIRTALRNEKTVAELEIQLQALQLEKARQSKPWELISTPTLLDKPVAPRKKLIVALGLLSGIVLGSGTALIVDRRTDLVFNSEELQRLLPCPLLIHLPAFTSSSWNDTCDLLASGPLAAQAGNGAIALIPIGELPSDQLEAFTLELRRALAAIGLSEHQLLVSTDLRETSKCSTQLLITGPGLATRSQVSQFCQKLTLQGAPLAGWVLLDPHSHIG